MTLYMPPMLSKRRVITKYNPDTSRIFGNKKADTQFQSHYSATHTGERKPPLEKRPPSTNRHHKPHPEKVGFLEQDCRLLHQPICHVATKIEVKEAEENHWWPSRTSDEPLKKHEYSYSTTNRSDYGDKQSHRYQQQISRHGSNPNSRPANGIVPVTHLPPENGPRLLVEKISYNHQYNARAKPTEPIRGKLHGSLVWDTLYPVNCDDGASDGSSMPPAVSP
ncbi:ciliary microtubule inner protein 6-like [Antedon mediterranea]|uniref:ciliary microtubule inner protein 6-like n=1 Tax=Antedon mediterranea TaxID=105859 RepID=UPI003AF77BBA